MVPYIFINLKECTPIKIKFKIKEKMLWRSSLLSSTQKRHKSRNYWIINVKELLIKKTQTSLWSDRFRIITVPLSVTTGSVYCIHRLLLSTLIIYLIEWSSPAFLRSSVLFKKWWVLFPWDCLCELPFLCSFHFFLLLGACYVSDAVLGAGDIDSKTNFLF